MVGTTPGKPLLPPDDLNRALRFARVDGGTAQHIGLVGDTYTITVAGEDTNDRFCVIDMRHPVAAPVRIAMTSKRPSSFSTVKWRLSSAAKNPLCMQATRSTFRPMRRISFKTHPLKRFE